MIEHRRIKVVFKGKARKVCDWRDFDSADVEEMEDDRRVFDRPVYSKEGIEKASELRAWLESRKKDVHKATVYVPGDWEPCYVDNKEEHWREDFGNVGHYDLATPVVARRLDPSFTITHETEKKWAKREYDRAVNKALEEYEETMSKFT